MFNQRLLSIVFALSIGSSSCWLSKPHARVFSPPPLKPRPPIPSRPPEVPPAPELAEVAMLEIPVILPPDVPQLPPPPAPRRLTPTPAPKPAAVATPAPVPDIPPAPLPKLKEKVPPQVAMTQNRELDEKLNSVKKALAVMGGKKLDAEELKTVQQIESFEKQAEQTREQDLVTAVNLARRADLLAQDLLKRLP